MATYETAQFSHASWNATALTDADWRTFNSKFEEAVGATGILTLVSSTADWVNDVKPAAGNWAPTATVWKFNDGVTPELYVKATYGWNVAFGAVQPIIGLQISPDNINYTTRNYVGFGASTSAITDMTWSTCFKDSAFVAVFDTFTDTATHSQGMFIVERSRGWTDTPNSSGAICMMTGSAVNTSTASGGRGWDGRVMRGSPSFSDTIFTNLIDYGPANIIPNAALNNELPAYAPYWVSEQYNSTFRSLCYVKGSVIGASTQVTVNDGVNNRTYRTPRSTSTAVCPSANFRLAYRWE